MEVFPGVSMDPDIRFGNPKHLEHASMMQWAGGDYDPDAFDPEGVVFEDPRKRWKVAFQQ